MRNLILILILTFFIACDIPGPRYDAADQFIVNTTVIDVAAGSTRTAMTVIVREGRILAVAQDSETDIPPGANIVHRGGFLIPGLWDMHVHSLGDPDAAVERRLPLYVAHGVTGIRDMGSIVAGVTGTRERLAGDASLLAPEIIAAGPLLDGVRLGGARIRSVAMELLARELA
jgi:imidazolonepropionase-like amidohydrolase